MYENFGNFIKTHDHISIIQAENPDGDSLGSAIALDYILGEKETTLYCPVDIPKYLHYFPDWSRVTNEFDWKADAYIIVDTAAEVLLSKLLDDPAIKNLLYTKPIFVIDHHETPDDLNFPHESIVEPRPSCSDLIFDIAKANSLKIEKPAAEALTNGILSDTLGLTSPSVESKTFQIVAELIDSGANVSELEEARREYMKKSPRILDYKADLIKRIEYHLDGRVATIHIPWEEICEYSDEYNPNVLILEEMRMIENVELAIAIKTYPDGKITGKIRSSKPIADKVSGYFGGGGHPYAAGFRTYDISYEDAIRDIIKITPNLLENA